MSISYSNKSVEKVFSLIKNLFLIADEELCVPSSSLATTTSKSTQTQTHDDTLFNLNISYNLNHINTNNICLNKCSCCDIKLSKCSSRNKCKKKIKFKLNDYHIANICFFVFISTLVYLYKYPSE